MVIVTPLGLGLPWPLHSNYPVLSSGKGVNRLCVLNERPSELEEIMRSFTSLPELRRMMGLLERLPQTNYRSFPAAMATLHSPQEAIDPVNGGYTNLNRCGLRFGYTVPAHACTEGGGTFPLSAVLSVIDDASTWAVIAADRVRRPGVSVLLKVERLRPAPIEPGERLTVVSHVSKVGKAMGFLAARVLDESGKVVAWGSHIKYMPMPPGWDIAFGRAYPLTRRLASLFARPAHGDAMSVAPEGEAANPPLLPLLQRGGSQAAAGDSVHMSIFDVAPEHLNGMPLALAGMHGGCQAMVHEVLAAEAAAAATGVAGLQCHAIELSYLSSGRVGTHSCAVDKPTMGVTANTVLTTSCIRSGDDGRGRVVSSARATFAACRATATATLRL